MKEPIRCQRSAVLCNFRRGRRHMRRSTAMAISGSSRNGLAALRTAATKWSAGGQHVRVAYDGENLEIMTTGYPHEGFKDASRTSAAGTQAFNIDRGTCGETAWKRPEISRGLQADQSYYFDPEKRKAAKAAWARKSNDIADYPNPDLAIEIDLSDPKVDRPSIYAALRVAEIWQFDGENVIIEHLQEDGTYALSESSRFLPIRAEDARR